MKRIFSILLLLPLLMLQAEAQVAKKVVAELFTNTRCGICAARIPGLKQNLENQPDVLLVTTHPSAPYSSCVLHQHNPLENDGRTSHYGVYGATPRLVIQGEVVPGSNFSNANLFTNQLNLTTPFSLSVKEIRKGSDSVQVEVTVKAVSSHSEVMGSLYVAYIEDTLAYSAPNGETEHWGVFRKAFSDVAGASVSLPAMGDSLVWTETIDINDTWILENMKVVAILSNQFNLALQSESTTSLELANATSIDSERFNRISIGPNPVTNVLEVSGIEGEWNILSISGQLLQSGELNRGVESVTVDVTDLPDGIYLFQNGEHSSRFVKRN